MVYNLFGWYNIQCSTYVSVGQVYYGKFSFFVRKDIIILCRIMKTGVISLKYLLHNKIITGIVGGVVVSLITSIILSYLEIISIFDNIKSGYRLFVSATIAILTYGIPVWVLILIIGLGILILWIYLRFFDSEIPNFLSYTEDIIFDIKWSWDWFKRSNGKYDMEVNQPVALCKDCSGYIIVSYSYILHCENCGFEKLIDMGAIDYRDKARREIDRRIYNNEFLKAK